MVAALYSLCVMGRKFAGQNFRQKNIKRQNFRDFLPTKIFSIAILLRVFDIPVSPNQSLRQMKSYLQSQFQCFMVILL